MFFWWKSGPVELMLMLAWQIGETGDWAAVLT